jgi:hypothetical protein
MNNWFKEQVTVTLGWLVVSVALSLLLLVVLLFLAVGGVTS